MKQIPQIVKDAASDLIEEYGDNFDYLGKYEIVFQYWGLFFLKCKKAISPLGNIILK